MKLVIDTLRDPQGTRRRADRGDFTPPGFAATGPAVVGREERIELEIVAVDEEEASHWSIGPTGQLRRDRPLPPLARSVVR